MNLSIRYLGLELPHPFIVGASPMIYKLDLVRRLEDAGAAAIVMHSLFEEQIQHYQSGIEKHIRSHEYSYAEATTYFPQAQAFHLGPEEYLNHIRKLKETVRIPIIASINGVNEGTWIEYAQMIEQAGADALELNLYFLPRNDEEPSGVVEQRCYQIVRLTKQFVQIPVAVKLSPYFTSLPNFARRMETAGANGLVLFNRFFQPDIDIEELEHVPSLTLSHPNELLLRLRWLAVLYGKLNLNLAVTGGVHTAEDAIKAIMAGADCCQIVSVLLQKGPEYLRELRTRLQVWMEEHEYDSLEQMKGSMSYLHSPNPDVVSRANYMRILQSWKV